MLDLIHQYRKQLASLCRRYGVRRLDLFGSAATQQFDPKRSDLDFIVEFEAGEADLFHRYFGLSEALEELFGRKVDLVMIGAMRNPHFIDSVNQTRQLVYAA